MLDRDLEKEQLPWCRKNTVAMLAYSPLHHGLLTGRVSPEREFKEGDLRRGHPSFTPENLKRTGALLDRIRPLADRRGLTLGQLVIAWTIAQPGVSHALVGARTPQQAVENAAAGAVELDPDELSAISAAIAGR